MPGIESVLRKCPMSHIQQTWVMCPALNRSLAKGRGLLWVALKTQYLSLKWGLKIWIYIRIMNKTWTLLTGKGEEIDGSWGRQPTALTTPCPTCQLLSFYSWSVCWQWWYWEKKLEAKTILGFTLTADTQTRWRSGALTPAPHSQSKIHV